MKPRCRIVETTFGRWILIHWRSTYQAWSGQRWVQIDRRGFGVTVQVSNFSTQAEAAAYAREEGFTVVDAYGRELVTQTIECSRCHRMATDAATRRDWEAREVYGFVCSGCMRELHGKGHGNELSL
jgi:hypothetical protein